MIRPVLRYGDAPLHAPAAIVQAFDDELQRLIDDMIETMYAAPGVGLAATQVGVAKRLFVIDLSAGRDPKGLITMVNPSFVLLDGVQLEDEGCLSIPGFNATVVRPAKATVTGLDRYGQPQTIAGTTLLARAFQHEMDHLDGKVFVDRLRGIKRDLIVRRIQKLKRAGKW
ncbi:MAG: peptide deformylase [Vicinamibacterales bacterium]